MILRKRLTIVLMFFILVFFDSAEAARFVPAQRTIAASSVKAGDAGYMLTVLRGTKPEKIPVKVVDVLSQSARDEVKNLILIRIMSKTVELAQGMSGSPVYIRGRLAGAVGSGWNFSDHTLALVTPIDDMCAVFDYESAKGNAKGKIPLASVSVSGLSGTSAAILERALGFPLEAYPGGASGGLSVETNVEPIHPGESLSALLAWGDVEIAATGAVTATSRDGRFLAFGHPFLKRGGVGYPAQSWTGQW